METFLASGLMGKSEANDFRTFAEALGA